MSSLKITELMPDSDTWPEWAQQAAAEGCLFRECMKRIEDAEQQYEAGYMSAVDEWAPADVSDTDIETGLHRSLVTRHLDPVPRGRSHD